MLVAIVGKMGQRERRWVNVPNYPADKPYGYWYQESPDSELTRWRSIAWQVQKETIGQWAPDAVPAIASWITSLGRMKLLRYIRAAGWSTVLYCDTDALIVTEEGYRKLCNANLVRDCSLGYLQLKEVTNECCIYGIKHYRIGGRLVAAGLPKNATIISQQESRIEFRSGPADYIRRDNRPSASSRISAYHSQADYRHGTQLPNGRIEPFRLNEEI
jgi:hypothetical protein